MFTPEEQPRDSGDLLEEVEVANVTDLRAMRRQCALTLTVRHPDVPEGISLGTFYLAATVGCVLKEIEAHFPAFLSDLETRISEPGSAALSPYRFWSPVLGAPVAGESVVRSRPKRR